MKKESALIIGGGLCGSLLAIRLAQRGHSVTVMESRPDLRTSDISAGRSINLAFSNRGVRAMELVGINKKVMELCIPMNGRMLHDLQGEKMMAPYSGRPNEYINSISRGGLNGLLLSEAESYNTVSLHFNKRCTNVDLDTSTATFEDEHGNLHEETADLIFGTDGAASALRQSYYDSNKFLFNFSRQFLQHGYKELSIPPTDSGDFRIEPNALHIWPRGSFMLIALPNLDKSFTVTLFLSYEGEKNAFEKLSDPENINSFFKTNFADAYEQMPNLVEEFQTNPTGPLGTVKCSPWNYKGKTLILGDAAHAIVPFYGQGMNASFEDVVVLDQFMDRYEGDWESIFSKYSEHRRQDSDAIADLAIDNFYEMRDHVANDSFRVKRAIEMKLEKEYPDKYFSKYSMVTFKEELGYNEAMTRGRHQDKVLLELIEGGVIDEDSDLSEVLNYLTK